MKTKVYFMAAALCLIGLTSCKKNESEKSMEITDQNSKNPALSGGLKKFPQSVIKISSLNGAATPNELLKGFKQSVSILRDSIWSNGNGHSVIALSDEQVILSRFIGIVYPGVILAGNSIANLDFNPVPPFMYTQKPTVVSTSIQNTIIKDTLSETRLSNARNSIAKILANNVHGELPSSFSFNITPFSNYNELKLSFGSNINIADLFRINTSGTNAKIKSNTGLIVKFTQKNFTVDMDLPTDGKLIEWTDDVPAYSPVFINSVTYGRMAIMYIESRDSSEPLYLAFKAALNIGIVKSDAAVTNDQKALISNATIKAYIINGQGQYAVTTISGYEDFKKYIIEGDKYSAQAPGTPISFKLRYLSDFSSFTTPFSIDLIK